MERFLPTGETLENATDDELGAAYSSLVDRANNQTNVADSVTTTIAQATFIREELHRRAMEDSGSRIERLTWWIAGFTLFNVVLVVVLVALAVL